MCCGTQEADFESNYGDIDDGYKQGELEAECKGKRKGADNDERLFRSSHIELVPKPLLEGLADALATGKSTRVSMARSTSSAHSGAILRIVLGHEYPWAAF